MHLKAYNTTFMDMRSPRKEPNFRIVSAYDSYMAGVERYCDETHRDFYETRETTVCNTLGYSFIFDGRYVVDVLDIPEESEI